MEKTNFKDNINRRADEIKKQLFCGDGEVGGGEGLMTVLMYKLIDDGVVSTDFLFDTLHHMFNGKKQLLDEGAMMPVNLIESYDLCKPHHAYACLDHDLKFCVKHYSEDDWKDVEYVFPYMNSMKAYDIIEKKKGEIIVESVDSIEDFPYMLQKAIWSCMNDDRSSRDSIGNYHDASQLFNDLKEKNNGNVNIAMYYEDKKRVALFGDDFVCAGIDDKLQIYEIADIIIIQDDKGMFHLTRNRFGKIDDEYCKEFKVESIYK